MRLIDADELKEDMEQNTIVLCGVVVIEISCAKVLIDNALTVDDLLFIRTKESL